MTARRTMTEEEIRAIAHEAAKQAVKQTFTTLGIDADNPLEAQKDFQMLRDWRRSAETVKKQSLVTAVGILTAGVLGAIYLYIKG